MSGSDFTLTPNLGLYKPLYDADAELWGDHINANSDVVDSAIYALRTGTIAGGPYLPTGGGTLGATTMSGPLTLAADPVAALQASTRQYVDSKVTASVAGVASFNTRTGAVTLSSTDVQAALTFVPAPAASPVITGTMTAPVTNAVTVREHAIALTANDIDCAVGAFFSKTIATATTFTVSNVPAAGTVPSFILELTNGGAATITWWAGVRWPGGVAPTLSGAGVDVLGFYTLDGGANWRGMLLGKGMA